MADELYYGGQAGGGKTDLLLGLGLTAHQRTVIFRRNFTQFKGGEGLLARALMVAGTRGHFSSRVGGLRMDDGRTIEFAGCEDMGELGKWKGRPHDLKAFDELSEFSEAMYLFLIGWARTTDPTQRVRIVGAGNPPTTVEGEWVIRRWGPWLDRNHERPADPGELRWFVRVEDKDTEVEDSKPVHWKGEELTPKSRTFIPASLKDNPYLARTGYAAQLQALPEPLRSQLLFGDYGVGVRDDPWQVIPTAWVEAAQDRWRESLQEGPADAAGFDVARGGGAKNVLAQRWGNWFAPLLRIPGSATPDSDEGARICAQAVLRGGVVNIDVGGPGAAVVDTARKIVPYEKIVAVNFGAGTKKRDSTGLLKFTNMRAQMYWALREALDPQSGEDLMLPPDPELKADLCAARYEIRITGIKIEDKDDVIKRLGRSPDAGDALVLAAIPGSSLVQFF